LYLIDTNVVCEARKSGKANPGVTGFLRHAATANESVYLSAVSVGELRRGIELVRYRGDVQRALLLATWLEDVLTDFAAHILPFDADAAQVWGKLRVPDPAHELDKQIAAIALINDLTLVTRNTADFASTGVRLRNPFQ
jgi:predicted nucleic acid-binding protein